MGALVCVGWIDGEQEEVGVGLNEGSMLSNLEGFLVVGINVGHMVGMHVGAILVGSNVGAKVEGTEVGDLDDGLIVGADVGFKVGTLDGNTDGFVEGFEVVGLMVGLDEVLKARFLSPSKRPRLFEIEGSDSKGAGGVMQRI